MTKTHSQDKEWVKLSDILKYPMVDVSNRIIEDCVLGEKCTIWPFVNIFKAKIGNRVSIGCFTEIGEAIIGDGTRIGMGCFIPKGIKIGKNCFISPKVCFCNDLFPSIKSIKEKTFKILMTIIEDNVVIGANSTILPGIKIGKGAFIGAGSVVTHNIGANKLVFGNPAK